MSWAKQGGKIFQSFRPDYMEINQGEKETATRGQQNEAISLFKKLLALPEKFSKDEIIKAIAETTDNTNKTLIEQWLEGTRSSIGPNVANLILRQLNRFNAKPKEIRPRESK